MLEGERLRASKRTTQWMLLELLAGRQIGGVKLEPNKKFRINHKKNIFLGLKTIANELDVGKLTDELSF